MTGTFRKVAAVKRNNQLLSFRSLYETLYEQKAKKM